MEVGHAHEFGQRLSRLKRFPLYQDSMLLYTINMLLSIAHWKTLFTSTFISLSSAKSAFMLILLLLSKDDMKLWLVFLPVLR